MSKNLSAVKRVQTSLRNNLRNKKYRSSVKTIVKKTLASISNFDESNNNINEVEFYLSKSYSRIDKAVKKGAIPKNQGAHKKSMLSKEFKKVFLAIQS